MGSSVAPNRVNFGREAFRDAIAHLFVSDVLFSDCKGGARGSCAGREPGAAPRHMHYSLSYVDRAPCHAVPRAKQLPLAPGPCPDLFYRYHQYQSPDPNFSMKQLYGGSPQDTAPRLRNHHQPLPGLLIHIQRRIHANQRLSLPGAARQPQAVRRSPLRGKRRGAR
jgi:hypothetical protein